MITIKPVSTSMEPEAPPTGAGDAPPRVDEQKKRLPLVWIPATIGFGLLIAAGYLGTRILAARARVAPQVSTLAATTPAPAVAATSAPVVGTTESTKSASTRPEPTKSELAKSGRAKSAPTKSAAGKSEPSTVAVASPALQPRAQSKSAVVSEGSPTLIAPRSGERYVQIGAITPLAVPRYLSELRRNKWEPKVAPGPRPELVRVLVGPFSDPGSILKARTQLQAERIDSFVRVY